MSQQSKAFDIIVMARGGVEDNTTSSSISLLEPSAMTNIAMAIENSSKNITYAISHPASTPFVSTSLYIALLTAICSTTAAFIYNKLHWKAVTARESRIKAAESIIELLIVLDEIAVDYWIKNYSKRYSRDNTKCEIKIKSCLMLINTLIPSLVLKINKGEQLFYKNKFEGYHEELFDLITGDDFETTSRKSNLTKAAKISNRCLQFRVELVNVSI
ncbi:Uncharacterised protein [Serratia quinivorans]|uniref:hypothetical protein n=1 Tax=Serratia quinivorans TaxID=137545 RepID=UPI0021795DF1|nr:hypothetical protein [Serratia quinivorans]CAI1056738.1 Uncharacterised protein [Serratia quinivorans]CAI1072008.1 Uncharacterised protein [Serratia quinivorans]CAI1874701.1 Uncharacterised protein [Serratia quinivorans]CAI2122829.1 Uncharacterised protein [Serratia quinivorans]CAI2489383.1 Uncharacterised protein [Serratia quinivorans]